MSNDEIPTINIDEDPVNANWIQILDARSRGEVNELDPRMTMKDRVKAQRRADQEREQNR